VAGLWVHTVFFNSRESLAFSKRGSYCAVCMSILDAALGYFDEHPHLAVLLDGDGRVLRISARLRKLARIADDDVIAGPLTDFVEPAAWDALQTALEAIREPGSRANVSFRIFGISHDNGSSPLLSWDLSRSRDGKTIFAVASEQSDQDSGRVSSNAFARDNHVLQHIIDNMPVVLWATDERGIFTLSDGAALATLGLQPGQVVGMNAFDVYAAETAIIASIRDALAGNFSCVITPGSGFTWESRYIPIRRKDGTVEGVIGFSVDVTDRVQAEDELRKKVELVEQQESAIRSLSTPIVRVWAGVLALPLVGILDATRIERILSALLEAVVHDQAEYVILDLTGIETVDGTTADHVFKVLRALALLGTQAIVTGIQPAVARALVEIGLDLGQVMTLGNLEEAIRFVMKRRNATGTALARAEKAK